MEKRLTFWSGGEQVETSDADLIVAAQANSGAYGTLYHRYAPKVFTFFLYRVGKDRELALDLTQDTFLRAYRHLSRYRELGYSYYSYLYTIAGRVLLNYYRAKKSLPLPPDLELPSGEAESRERAGVAATLWQAVADLPQLEKNIFLRRYQDDRSIREIAGEVGKTENAVKLILFRARRRLLTHPALAEFKPSN